MSVSELQALERRYSMDTYARAPVEFVRGEGATLWDADGNEYLDFLSGIAVCNTGHCHPQVVAAVQEQAARLLHVSNLFYTAPPSDAALRRSASRTIGAVQNRLETCISRPACSRIAATTRGWQWPVLQTAIPASRSR